MDAQQLLQLKQRYGNIYEVTVKDQVFFIRELRRAEYRYLLDTFPEETDIAICQVAVIYPEEYDFATRVRAGLTAALADEIVFASKLGSPAQYEALFEEKRKEMNNFENQAEAFILQAFPNISFDEMGNWTMEELMNTLAKAEWALKNVWQLPVEFKPKEEQQEGEEAEEQVLPTMKELGDQWREIGYDPMVMMHEEIMMKNRKRFVDFPMIGGTKLLEKAEVLDNVREQIQRVSK